MIPFLSFIQYIPKGTTVLLGFSGGCDSSVLLDLLAKDSIQNGYSLRLCHVNHGIRGEEAKRDEDFCKQKAEAYHLPIDVVHLDIPKLAKEQGKGLEECAREQRYQVFLELAEKYHCSAILTAHQANDNAETFLFRLIRGCGTHGLSSIFAVSDFHNILLLRPLLNSTREQIENYAKENNISYVQDSTNDDTDYSRNKIRHQVLPELEKINSSAIEHIVNTVCDIQEEDEYFINKANEFLANQSLSIANLQTLEKPILIRVFQILSKKEFHKTLDRNHISQVLDLIKTGKGKVSLGRNESAELHKNIFSFQMNDKQDYSYHIPFEKAHSTENLPYSMEIKPINTYHKSHSIISFPSEEYMKECYFRSYQEGDSIFSQGIHKKVRKLWQSLDIIPSRRKFLPVLCYHDEIIWVYAFGQRELKPSLAKYHFEINIYDKKE